MERYTYNGFAGLDMHLYEDCLAFTLQAIDFQLEDGTIKGNFLPRAEIQNTREALRVQIYLEDLREAKAIRLYALNEWGDIAAATLYGIHIETKEDTLYYFTAEGFTGWSKYAAKL